MYWFVYTQGQSEGSLDDDFVNVYLSEQEALENHEPGYSSINTCEGDQRPDVYYWCWLRVSEPIPQEFIPKEAGDDYRWSFGPGIVHTCNPPNSVRSGRRGPEWF